MGRVPIHSSRRLEAASIANRAGNTLPPQTLRSSAKTGSFTVSLTEHIQVDILKTLVGCVFFNQLRHGRGVHDFARAQQNDLGCHRFHVRNNVRCHKRMIRSFAISASNSRRRTRSFGSRPAVGSSKISNFGSPSRADANSRRCFMPPE